MPERRLLGVVGQVLIELRVLLLGDLALGLDPDRLLVVEDFAALTRRIGCGTKLENRLTMSLIRQSP